MLYFRVIHEKRNMKLMLTILIDDWIVSLLTTKLSLISADNFRPYLTSFQGNAFTDYINAVFVDVSFLFYESCQKKKEKKKWKIKTPQNITR